MLIPGHATRAGTARFALRFEKTRPRHFRESEGLSISSIGLGTYLGEPTEETDAAYRAAVTRAAQLGVNVLDTAINYRHQRSERAIGQALREMIANGQVARDEIFLATKGGFLTFDAAEPPNPARYFEEEWINTKIISPEDVAAGCHVMTPGFLERQIEVSRQNLGVETIDLYYVHNPETQLSAVPREMFYARLTAAFRALERAVAEKKIRMYGTATWNAYRVAPEAHDAVSLALVLKAAREAGGAKHHFRAIQLPFNLAMLEGLKKTQPGAPDLFPPLQMAFDFGLMVFASASLLQSRLASGLPGPLRAKFRGLSTDAQRAIQFVRSTPGITCALVGMSDVRHVEENLSTASTSPLEPADFRSLFTH